MAVFTTEQKSTEQAITTLSQDYMERTAETGATGDFTATHVINGIYHQTDGGTPGTRTLVSAATLWAAIRGCKVGTSFRFIVHNADGADTLTVAVPASITAFGTLTVAPGKTREFVVVFTSSTAAVLYALAALA